MKILEVDSTKLKVLAFGREYLVTEKTLELSMKRARKLGEYYESMEDVEAQVQQVLAEQTADLLAVCA